MSPSHATVPESQIRSDASVDLGKLSTDRMDLLEQTKPTLEWLVNKIIPSDFDDRTMAEKTAYLQRLSPHEKRLLLSYVRYFDAEIGNEIHAIQPENPEYIRLIAVSFTKRAELAKNAKRFAKDGFVQRLEALRTASQDYPSDLRNVVESVGKRGVSEMDMLRLRQAWVDLMPLFFVSPNRGPTDKNMVAPGRKYVVDLSGMNSVQRFVGYGDIFPDTVQEISVNGRHGVRKDRPRPGFYDSITGEYLSFSHGHSVDIVSVRTLSEQARKASVLAHQARFENVIADEFSALVRKGLEQPHVAYKPATKEEAFAAASVIYGVFRQRINPETLFSHGVDLGNAGTFAPQIKELQAYLYGAQKNRENRTTGVPRKAPVRDIVSRPAERSKNGTTLCSKTARENAEYLFGLRWPRGDAIDVQNAYGPIGKRHAENSNDPVEIALRLPSGSPREANVADVFTGSKSQYGHRAIAFRRENEWYVLDPYWNKTTEPVHLSQYKAPIRKVALYAA